MMKRKVFLKALAALGLGGLGINDSEEPGMIEVKSNVSFRTGISGEEIRRISLTSTVPDSIDSPAWDEMGISREDLHALATKNYIMRLQMHARTVMRSYPDMAEEDIQEAMNNFRFRTSPPRGRKI